jgi:predicted RNA polymerase sigma factor
LLVHLGRDDEAVAAYRRALELEPAAAERAFITRRVRGLGAL